MAESRATQFGENDKSNFLKFLDVLKKPVDILDDVWNLFRGLISPKIIDKVGPFLIGTVMLFIHFIEAYNGIRDTYHAYNNANIGQRKLRLLTNILISCSAISGIGLGLSYLVYQFSHLGFIGAVSVSSFTAAMCPAILPGLLATIYAISLGRKTYTLSILREEEKSAKELCDSYIKSFENFTKYSEIEAQNYISKYEEILDKIRIAEKEVYFGVVEVLSSVMVTSGAFLLSLISVGAIGLGSIASLGALPIALLITGVALGFASKFIEYKDDKTNGSFSTRLRNYFAKPVDIEELKSKLNTNKSKTLNNLNYLDLAVNSTSDNKAERCKNIINPKYKTLFASDLGNRAKNNNELDSKKNSNDGSVFSP
ncbi:hypothetical protein N9L02_02490 [Gammaproteobacteria bacterium]|nr:hypothetical protein [Gammaproteobacteria bacterium]